MRWRNDHSKHVSNIGSLYIYIPLDLNVVIYNLSTPYSTVGDAEVEHADSSKQSEVSENGVVPVLMRYLDRWFWTEAWRNASCRWSNCMSLDTVKELYFFNFFFFYTPDYIYICTSDNADLRTVAVEGFCRLLLLNHIASPPVCVPQPLACTGFGESNYSQRLFSLS